MKSTPIDPFDCTKGVSSIIGISQQGRFDHVSISISLSMDCSICLPEGKKRFQKNGETRIFIADPKKKMFDGPFGVSRRIYVAPVVSLEDSTQNAALLTELGERKFSCKLPRYSLALKISFQSKTHTRGVLTGGKRVPFQDPS